MCALTNIYHLWQYSTVKGVHMLRNIFYLGLFLSVILSGAGCESDLVKIDVEDSDVPATSVPQSSNSTVTASSVQVPAGFSGVKWLHTNVSGWSETASLNGRISGGTITLDYSKKNSWPSVNGLNANPWIFVYRDGTWYAATFEWFRSGQVSKPTSTVAGDHIKRSPLNDFRPVSGEVYGFMVSGLARDDTRNVRERTGVQMIRWP